MTIKKIPQIYVDVAHEHTFANEEIAPKLLQRGEMLFVSRTDEDKTFYKTVEVSILVHMSSDYPGRKMVINQLKKLEFGHVSSSNHHRSRPQGYRERFTNTLKLEEAVLALRDLLPEAEWKGDMAATDLGEGFRLRKHNNNYMGDAKLQLKCALAMLRCYQGTSELSADEEESLRFYIETREPLTSAKFFHDYKEELLEILPAKVIS